MVEVEGQAVEIPEGWKLAKGRVQPGDRHLNHYKFLSGVIEWLESWPPSPSSRYYQYVNTYTLVIRRIEIPEGTG